MVAAAELLGQLLLQDVERTDDGVGLGVGLGVSLKDGVSRDRMMSVHDPELRHGHKSSSRRFDGHKGGDGDRGGHRLPADCLRGR